MILSTGENIIQKKRKVSTKFQFSTKLNSKIFDNELYFYEYPKLPNKILEHLKVNIC